MIFENTHCNVYLSYVFKFISKVLWLYLLNKELVKGPFELARKESSIVTQKEYEISKTY